MFPSQLWRFAVLRDLAVWLWINAIRASWYTFGGYFLAGLPGGECDTCAMATDPHTTARPRVPWWRCGANHGGMTMPA